MEYFNRVTWCEGMLLEPQHFQQQERYLQHDLYRKLITRDPNYYGIFSIEIDTHLLEQGKYNIIACVAIFPDGTYYDAPNHDHLPDCIDLNESNDNNTISLTLSLLQPNQLDKRHNQQTYQCKDTLSGKPSHADLQIAKLKPSLTLGNNQGRCILNIAKIKNSRNNNTVTLDNSFLPPCLNVYHYYYFKQFMQQYTGLLQQRCEMLSNRLRQSAQPSMNEYADHCLLQTLNRYLALFQHKCHPNQLHPHALHTLLIQLRAELTTYTVDRIRNNPTEPYQHNDLLTSFSTLTNEINTITKNILQQHSMQLESHYQANGIYNIKLDDIILQNNNDFILALCNAGDHDVSIHDIIKNIKIAPSNIIDKIIQRALPGITLNSLNTTPREVPHYNKSIYFKLDKQHSFWGEFDSTNTLSIHMNHSLQNHNFDIWAIKEMK